MLMSGSNSYANETLRNFYFIDVKVNKILMKYVTNEETDNNLTFS